MALFFLFCLLFFLALSPRKCNHDMQELTYIEIKDEQGDTIGHEFILICKKCGKVRKVRL